MNVPTLKNFDQARRAVVDVSRRIDAVASKLERLSQAKDAKDEDIALNLVTLGVRIGRITEHVAATEGIENVFHGYAQLVNVADYSTDSDQVVPVYNITDKEYTVGTLVALLPVQGSFFICSDPGIFPAAILPQANLMPAVGATYFEWETLAENSLINSPVPYIAVSDALDGVDTAADPYSLELKLINGEFTFDAGDSNVTLEVVNTSDIFLFGTLDELNALLVGDTTGTLTINPTTDGADTLYATLYDLDRTRQGTYSLGTLAISAAAPAPSTTYDVQVFYNGGSTTWTKPANAVTVRRYLIGGGGGGGGGRRGAAGSIRRGGGGGGGGGYSSDSNPEVEFDTTETIAVGAGGAQGARAAADNANGGNGGTGGNSSMTATGTGGATLTANGGTGGAGGTNSGAAGGTGGTGTTENGANGGAGGGAGSGTAGGSSSTKMAGAGGGGGWGGTAAGGNDAGGYGGDSGGLGGQWSNSIGSVAVDNTGIDGHPGGQFLAPDGAPFSFGGGGGGGAFWSSVAAGVVGAIGGRGNLYGAGGGGGGGNTNGCSGFNMGEIGAPGIAIIITECQA